MAIGTVKWFNATKGCGFIEPEDSSKGVFPQAADVERAGISASTDGQRIQ